MDMDIEQSETPVRSYLVEPFPELPMPDAPRIYAMRFGDVNCCPESHHHLHRHTYYEIAYLSRGQATLFVDFEKFALDAGTLAFITPGQVHTWTDKSDAEILVSGFQPDVFALHGQDAAYHLRGLPFGLDSHLPYVTGGSDHQTALRFFFERLVRNQNAPAEQREALLLAYLNVALAEARPLCEQKNAERGIDNGTTSSAASRLTREFRAAVESCYLERRQVQAYAAELGVTAGHLIEVIRQTTGQTPGEIIDARLALEAKRLLVHTNLSVAEIAHALSFASPSQFGRWFRNLTDAAPGDFRRQFSAD